jgi:hypothetical protein
VNRKVFDNAEQAELEVKRLRITRRHERSQQGQVVERQHGDGRVVCELSVKATDDKLIAAAPAMHQELLRQMREAWMRLDYKTADRIADLIGEVRPTDHEKEDL